MKKGVIFAALLSILIPSVFFFSCRKENKNPSWDVDVLAPLVNSTLTVNDIIPDSILHPNPDNSLDIVFQTPLYSLSSDSLFKIPDTTLTNTYVSPLNATVAPGGSIISFVPNNIKYSLGDAQLTHAVIRSGKMLLNLKSGVQGPVDFNYKIPSLTDAQGNIFDVTVKVPAATGTVTPGTYSGSFDLSGYKVNLTGPGGSSVNTLMTGYSASVSPASEGGYTTTINPGDAVQISNTFDQMIMEYAKGYFGSTVTATGPKSTAFSMFSHITDGTLNLSDVHIDFTIENSIGADARLVIHDLSSVNTRTGTILPLQHPIINSPININRATDNNGNVIPTLYKFSITPSSPSNILAFIDNLPDQLGYNMDMQLNPLGNTSGSNDFIYYGKLMKTDMNVTIPLSLVANNLTMSDTVDFKLTTDAEHVNRGNLYVYAQNGFPFTAGLQLYLLDDHLKIADSLISAPNAIQPPSLDANLICIGQRLTKLTIPLNENKMNLLRSSRKMYIKTKFTTAGQPNYVKIYSFYRLNLKITGDFNYTVGKIK